MAVKSRFLQLDGLISLSFLLTNLARTDWFEGPPKVALMVIILFCISFIIYLFFAQKGFSNMSPLGIGAIMVGFVPSALWYLVRMMGSLGFPDMASRVEGIYEVINYGSVVILAVGVPYIFLRRPSHK